MRKRTKVKLAISIPASGILLPGCLTATNYYTARTLPNGAISASPGVDNIVVRDLETGENIDTEPPCSASFGLARGFPYRTEAGIRVFLPPPYLDYLDRFRCAHRNRDGPADSPDFHACTAGCDRRAASGQYLVR